MIAARPSAMRFRLNPLLGYAVILVCGAMLTGMIFWQQKKSEKRHLTAQFERDALLRANLIQFHLNERQLIVSALHSFYTGSENVTQIEFKDFSNTLLTNRKELQVLGWLPRISDAERDAFEKRVQETGYPGFRIIDFATEQTSIVAPQHEDYFPIEYMEPTIGNETKIGLTSLSPPIRRAALKLARASELPAVTERIRFFYDDVFGFRLMYWSVLPIGFGISVLLCLILRSIRIRGKVLEQLSAERTAELHHYQSNLESLVEERSAEILRTNKRLQQEVADRKQAEILLQNSEMRLRSILDSTAEAIYGIDTDGKCMFCNRSCLEMLGYKNVDDLLGKNMHWQIHHSRADGTPFPIEECQIFHSFKSGVGARVEDDILWRADGSSFPAEYWSYPQRLGDQVIGSVVAFVDISDRKRSQEALQQNEARLRAIYEGSSDAFFLLTDKGFFDCNPAAVKILGYTAKEEIIGLNPCDILPPTQPDGMDSLRFSQERIQNAYQFGSDHFEVEQKRKDGSLFPAEVLLTAFNYGGQQVIHATLRDITLRKNSEKELRKLSVAVEQNPATIVITDRQGNIEYVNAKFCDTTGYSYNEAIGNNPRILKSGDTNSPEDYKNLWDTLLSGREWRGEFHNKKKNGELYWEQALIAPIKDEIGKITHFIAIKEDITKRRESEEVLRKTLDELAAMNHDLKKANQIKSLFLATMSHEIRTPLNAVIGMTGLLLDTKLDDEQRDQAETVRKSAEILLALINDILDFSKIEAEKVELENQPFDLRRCVEDSLELLAGKAKSKNIILALEIQSDLPPFFEGDITRLRQILVNLISNAVKFTLEGSVTVSVSGEPAEDGRYHLHFQVRDTGIGISDNVRDRLFKPFSQGDTSTNRRFGGTGLGLAISKRLCELMGGRIWVESNCSVPGGGSTFHFTITTFASDLPPAWLPTNGSEEDDGGNCLVSKNIVLDYPPENLKILLAEDNLVNQKVALKMLSKLGYRVDVASNGLEVLAALHRIPYDVILMDCQMPEMDGYDATLQIRASELASKRPPVRIIAMTAYAMKGDEEECLASGMDDYLSKPVREAELRRALQKCRPAASLVTVEPAAIPDVSPPEEIVEELLDTVTLQEMADVDVTDIVELVDLFRTQTKELMTALNWAVASAESQEINRIAHKLAGSSAACGLKAVITPLRELEKKGKEGDLRRTGDLLDRIDQLLKSSDLALDRYIDDLRKC